MTQWASLCVSVLDFRGVTSEIIFQNSTPMFCPVSIEKSNFFLLVHRYILVSVLRNCFAESLFFVFSTANFEAVPPPVLNNQKTGKFHSHAMDSAWMNSGLHPYPAPDC